MVWLNFIGWLFCKDGVVFKEIVIGVWGWIGGERGDVYGGSGGVCWLVGLCVCSWEG